MQPAGKPPPPRADWATTLRETEDAVANLDDRIRRDWSAERNKSVKRACADARLVAEFVARYLDRREVTDPIRAEIRQDKDFVDAFEMIQLTVNEFGSCLVAIDDAETDGKRDKLIVKLASLADDLRQALEEAVNAFVSVVNGPALRDRHSAGSRSRAVGLANEIQSHLQARRLIHDAEQALDTTLRVQDETNKVFGDVGPGRFATHYASHAESETRIADRLRWTVAGLLAVIAGGAVTLNVLLPDVSIGTELIRLSATIPVAVLAGYFARESSKHRESARWASELAIAMQTLPSYTEPLDASGIELRRALGMRVFGSGANQPTTLAESGLYDDLAKILDKLEDFLRRTRETVDGRPKSS